MVCGECVCVCVCVWVECGMYQEDGVCMWSVCVGGHCV